MPGNIMKKYPVKFLDIAHIMRQKAIPLFWGDCVAIIFSKLVNKDYVPVFFVDGFERCHDRDCARIFYRLKNHPGLFTRDSLVLVNKK